MQDDVPIPAVPSLKQRQAKINAPTILRFIWTVPFPLPQGYLDHNRDLSSASAAAAGPTGSSTTCRAAVFFASLKALGSLRKDSSPENFLFEKN